MNPVEAYRQRKAEKQAKKEAEKIAVKELKNASYKADVEAKTRKPSEIEKDLDATSKEIGKWHHQMKCCEATISGLTDKFHNYILELSKSKEVYPEEFAATVPNVGGVANEI